MKVTSDPPTRKHMEETRLTTITVESAGLGMDFNYYGRLIRVWLIGEGTAPAMGKPTNARPGADVEARSEDPELLLGLTAGDAIEWMGSEMSAAPVALERVRRLDPDELRTRPAAMLFFRKKGWSVTINYYGEVIAVNKM